MIPEKEIPECTFTFPVAQRNVRAMNVYEIRWQNFRALIGSDHGAITDAAKRMGKTQGQVSHFGGARPIKNIGHKLAREIEKVWRQPEGWLDAEHSSAVTMTNGQLLPASHSAIPDPATLAEAYLLAVQEAGLEGMEGDYRLEADPERTVRAYEFLAEGKRSAADIARYMTAAITRREHQERESKNERSARSPRSRTSRRQ